MANVGAGEGRFGRAEPVLGWVWEGVGGEVIFVFFNVCFLF